MGRKKAGTLTTLFFRDHRCGGVTWGDLGGEKFRAFPLIFPTGLWRNQQGAKVTWFTNYCTINKLVKRLYVDIYAHKYVHRYVRETLGENDGAEGKTVKGVCS